MFSDFLSFISDLIHIGLDSGSDFSNLSNQLSIVRRLPDLISGLSSAYFFIIACFALAIGLAGCFFGYKLSRIFMATTGFAAGSALGGFIAYEILDLSTIFCMLASLVGGIILSYAAFWIYRGGVFLLGFVLAFLAGATFLPVSGDLQFFLCIILGLAVGILAIKSMRPVIIFTTAILFGSTIASSAFTVCEYMNYDGLSSHFGKGMLTMVVIVLGIFVQFMTTEEPEKKGNQKKELKQSKKELKKLKKQQKRREKDNVIPTRSYVEEPVDEILPDYDLNPVEEVYEEETSHRSNLTFASKEKNHKKAVSHPDRDHKNNKRSQKKKSSHEKKSFFSSFMEAVDAGDSDADYISDVEPSYVDSLDSYYEAETPDNSDRPIESGNFRQL